MIAIVDSGLSNIGSVANMLDHIGAAVRIARSPADLAGADRIVLPGVGSFDRGMEQLERGGFRAPLDRLVAAGMPVLGICLGFQMMGRRSAEGRRPGLGWIDAETRSFDAATLAAGKLRLPHIGWSDVLATGEDPILASPRQRFYFVHSYHVVCDRSEDAIAVAEHGVRFTAAVRRGNLIGVQFHPEKSHRHGMELLRRFAGLPG